MKRILALTALLWASAAFAADNPIGCTGASCKVLIQPRTSGGTKVTGVSVDGGTTNTPTTFGAGNFTSKLGSTTKSAQFGTTDTTGATFGPALELSRPGDGTLVGGLQVYSTGAEDNTGIFSRNDIVFSSNGAEAGRFSSNVTLQLYRNGDSQRIPLFYVKTGSGAATTTLGVADISGGTNSQIFIITKLWRIRDPNKSGSGSAIYTCTSRIFRTTGNGATSTSCVSDGTLEGAPEAPSTAWVSCDGSTLTCTLQLTTPTFTQDNMEITAVGRTNGGNWTWGSTL